MALGLFCATPAAGAILISNLSNTGGFQDISSGGIGQAFTVNNGVNATITGATVRLNPFTDVRLAASSLSLVDGVTGAVLGTFTRTTAFAGNAFSNYAYTLNTPVVLTQNSLAAIQFTTTGDIFRWSDPGSLTNTSNGLTHAYQYFDLAPAPSNLQRPNRMLSYEIEGTLSPAGAPTPEPATWALMGTCLATLVALRRRAS